MRTEIELVRLARHLIKKSRRLISLVFCRALRRSPLIS